MRPSPTEIPTLEAHSTKILATLIQYAPLSTSSCRTLIEYAPLSSTTSPALNHQSTLSTASTSIPPSSSRTADPSLSNNINRQTTDSPIAFAIVVLILLGLMLATATMMWLGESKVRQKSQGSKRQERKIISKSRANAEPIGLGITLHPAVEERREIGGYTRLRDWLSNIVDKGKSVKKIERWTDFMVSRARTDLDINAEDGLLLPVRESERIGREKNRIDVELGANPGC